MSGGKVAALCALAIPCTWTARVRGSVCHPPSFAVDICDYIPPQRSIVAMHDYTHPPPYTSTAVVTHLLYKPQLLKSRLHPCRSIGVSNFGIPHLEVLLANCKVVPAVNQVEQNPYITRTELSAYCKEKGIVMECYSPLTKGERLNDPKLVEIAKRCESLPLAGGD